MTPNAIINNSENVNQTTEPLDHVELPADTWICSIQGCGKTIYKASSKRSKEAILDHSLVHAEDTQTKLNLVFAEQRHNINVSVSHLVSRIRDFGAHQESVGTSDKPEFRGPTSPKKIKL
ncbi:conserved hypothetical protein [Histoplasma mississippiense (nom. inval.)]|uniref:conserved hypothetical protein n=1 Tax=Ajellomyces capsulatus (strain NAm1 / WU24) TaxID=2059318 RepID=UPI000157BC75|nr:conserved hypothetical protein [Histoplasma mississippiense (nom. inval.)]EDN05991.1 conserved hypothetical protein [Histoplasma mississippiense (nom. inval.)]